MHQRELEFDNPKRTIVHDFGDKITMNFSNDYPGGVNIEGQLKYLKYSTQENQCE